MFKRVVSIDWSGAGSEFESVDLRIASYDVETDKPELVPRKNCERMVRAWTRSACFDWLVGQLRPDQPATLVLMDFGFGLPWGSDAKALEVRGWRQLIKSLHDHYCASGTARAAAEAINALSVHNGRGPFRFNESRNDFHFYTSNSVSYFRMTECVAPQAISQWYLGSGGTVGFHTITGLSAIHRLCLEREKQEVSFLVWPHDGFDVDGKSHVLAESYPAVCPKLDDYGPCIDDHQCDAWQVLEFCRTRIKSESLLELFALPKWRVGGVDGVSAEDQFRFEGLIFGIR